jgi:hypothetical protein
MKSGRLRWADHVACMGERRCAYRALVGKPERRRPFEKPCCRYEDNIRKDLLKVGWDMDWIDLAQERDRWPALVTAVNFGFHKMRRISSLSTY